MIPQIDNSMVNEVIEIISYPNLTYKCTQTQIAGKVDNLKAIEQAIEHILSTERYSYLIYDDNYGVELNKYIGQSREFVEATIEDTLREALTQDDRIEDVSVTDIYEAEVKLPTIEKALTYNVIITENDDALINEDSDILITNRTDQLVRSSINKEHVLHVEFDVYCKQGVIHKEVNVNV